MHKDDIAAALEAPTRYLGQHAGEGLASVYGVEDENLDLFRRMRAGEFATGAKTLRAKIDMASGNINMRDPVLYRVLHARHRLRCNG